ncbi:Golgin IMH1 [Rhypophila decipiens]
MFQRLKTTLDRAVANEQQRHLEAQRTPASASSQRPGQRSRASSGAGTHSPARKPRPTKKSVDEGPSSAEGAATNVDPAIFEAAFVIDETDEAPTPARVATPNPGDKKTMAKDADNDEKAALLADAGKKSTDSQELGEQGTISQGSTEGSVEQPSRTGSPSTPVTAELSPEIKSRLKKLEKLEKTYPELLRSYRIAHGRVSSIEPFEKALRENTPLTSIKDPEAFVEYLNQLNLKSDMVMDELKRVSGEKDALKTKSEAAEKELAAVKEEIAALNAEKLERKTSPNPEPKTAKDKGDESRVERKSEEFFSYDNEIPDLQAEVDMKTGEIVELRTEVQNLTQELSVAKEKNAGLVENLENVSRELGESRDAVAVKESVETQLEARKAEIETLTERLAKTQTRVKELESQLETEKTIAAEALKEKSSELAASVSKYEGLESELKTVSETKSALDQKIGALGTEIDQLNKTKAEDLAKLDVLTKKLDAMPAPEAPVAGETSTPRESINLAPPATGNSKKKNKKKNKKGGAAAATPASLEPTPSEVSVGEQPLPSPAETSASGELNLQISRLREELAEKDSRIERLSQQRKTEEDLREEIETLRHDLLDIGSEHVDAKERIKELEAEKKQLQSRIAELEKEVADKSASAAKGNAKLQSEHESLKEEFDSLKSKLSTLHSDLAAAQQLAQTRYKDLTDLREVLQKAQPELKALRQESATLKTTKEELASKTSELRNLEKREKDLKTELTRAQRLASDRETEIKSLHDKLSQETNTRLRLEDEKRVSGRDLRRSEAEKIELAAKSEKLARELERIQEEASKLRPRIKELEDDTFNLKKAQDLAKEDADLKQSQYASAQNLLASMRDQTAELTVQLKESQSQCESLDEELAETRKLLNERTREAETMRRLLADVDERANSKVREMHAKMEAAVEERDRLEDESSALARRKSRETEELKGRIKDLEKEVKTLGAVKDELEDKEREWRRRREELEACEERADREVNEMRSTVSNLRSTLDASEQQVRDMERKNGELRRALDDFRLRYDKVSKEVKSLQGKLATNNGSPAARGSMDSTRSGTPSLGAGSAAPDAMYLKTILLQFLEQRDNKLRAQLVPVLGKLLKFDKADEQKWLAAIQHITTK